MNKLLTVGTGISGIHGIPMLGGKKLKSLAQLIKALFSKGEQGFAYDMSDMSTLFQDALGTIPVTAAGQPVGLMLDKSKGLVLGGELLTNNWNLTGQTDWTYADGVLTKVSTTAGGGPSQMNTTSFVAGQLYKIEFEVSNLTGGSLGVMFIGGTNSNVLYATTNGTFTGYLFANAGNNYLRAVANSATARGSIEIQSVKAIYGNHAYQTVSASRPVLRQTPILGNELVVNGDFSGGLTNVAPRNIVTTEIVAGALKVTNAGTFYGFVEMALPTEVGKTYLFRGDVVESSGTGATFHIASVTNSNDIANNVEGSTAAKGVTFTAKTTTTYLSLKTPSNATGAWRIFDNISIKEITGYRSGRNYLEFDGVDDGIQTNAIDFTMTDKISLFAGVRKLSDAATSIVAELSSDPNNVNGSVALASLATQVFQIASRGSISSFRQSSVNSSPFSCVITTKSAIGADINTMRVNSLDQGTTSTDQGIGNYGNYPLYIGRRGGTSLPFSGHIYSLIGISRLTTDAETLALEKIIAKLTGVIL